MYDGMKLVEGRECGECTMCCTVPLIDTPEIQKVSGAPCRHSINKGCAIYETRPTVCRGFYCAWRVFDIMGPDWRPDKSQVFSHLEVDDIPPQFALRTGITLMLIGNPLKTVRERWFQEFVGAGVVNGIPLFLSLPGGRGQQGAKQMLNTDEMLVAANSRIGGNIRGELEKALKRVGAHDFQTYVMKNTGNDTSSEVGN
jgi:hypothetical protein